MDSRDEDPKSRRRALKVIGAAGAGIGGLGTVAGSAAADDVSTDEFNAGGGGGGATNYIGIDHERSASNIPVGEACDWIGTGCWVVTVGALADMIPGDEIVVAASCAVVDGECNIIDIFAEEHGDVNVDVFTITAASGDYQVGDAVVVPSSWNW